MGTHPGTGPLGWVPDMGRRPLSPLGGDLCGYDSPPAVVKGVLTKLCLCLFSHLNVAFSYIFS